MLPCVALLLVSLIASVLSFDFPPVRGEGARETPNFNRSDFWSAGKGRLPAGSPTGQPVKEQKAEQRPPDAQAIAARKQSERLLVVCALLAILAMVGGILLLFFLVYRAGRAKALRLVQAPLNELWGLPHLQGLDADFYDLWVLVPPPKSLSRTWSLFSRQSESIFQLHLLRGRQAEWQGDGPKVHFRETQELNRVNGPVEVVVDETHRLLIERALGLGPHIHHFEWGGNSYQASYQKKQDRIELNRNGTLHAVSDLPNLAGSPRVLAVPKGDETALILIFAYLLLPRN